MAHSTIPGPTRIEPEHDRRPDLVPREFLRVIAVWSVIPVYLCFGAFLGWLVDRAFGWFPYATGVGLLLALIVSVRDMLRLRDSL
jgi:hypothetical protein